MHGITNEEIGHGASFHQAWERFLQWVNGVMDTATKSGQESDDETELPVLLEDPIAVLVAHNGVRFDFPYCFANYCGTICLSLFLNSDCLWILYIYSKS